MPTIKECVGDGDLFVLLYRAISPAQRLVRSAKGIAVPGGVLVLTSSTFYETCTLEKTVTTSEALAYVPGVYIADDVNGGHRLRAIGD